MPQLVENVLQSRVMKTASTERGRQVIERAKCLDCHKFGTVGQGLGPDLTTVSSRFRPIGNPRVDRRAVQGDLRPVQASYGRH